MAKGLELAQWLSTAEFPPFSPKPYYEHRTDSLIFYARNDRSYSERLNAMFTLFLAVDDGSLVGCEVKGVKRLVEHLGDFGVLVHDDTIDLSILIAVASAAPADGDDVQEIYERELLHLKQAAKNIELRRDTLTCAV